MNLLEAIRQADELRPNELSGERKAAWIYTLEAEYAVLTGAQPPRNPYPEDAALLMPYPYDDSYPLYLAARIDAAQAETELYENDMVLANQAVARAKTQWLRTHAPAAREYWRVM